MAEIEHFVHPQDKEHHNFAAVKDKVMTRLSQCFIGLLAAVYVLLVYERHTQHRMVPSQSFCNRTLCCDQHAITIVTLPSPYRPRFTYV